MPGTRTIRWDSSRKAFTWSAFKSFPYSPLGIPDDNLLPDDTPVSSCSFDLLGSLIDHRPVGYGHESAWNFLPQSDFKHYVEGGDELHIMVELPE